MDKIDFKNISLREKIIMGVTLVAAISYGYYQFEYMVQEKRMKNVKSRLSEVDTSAAALEQVLMKLATGGETEKKIARKKENIARLREEIDVVRAKMKGSANEIIREIQNEAEEQNIVIANLRTRDRELRRGKLRMKEINLLLELRGDYRAIQNFLLFLDVYPALLSIESLKIKRNEEIMPRIENTLHIKIYSL
ncbi:hypothetical protein UR09_05985 [Candidatus Nitromaritima sp. SCGC AAA799-A02]|nr:hypothetical protein UR09_05985 [Candidatus Nitromaritima sp. SCGC AAA799-A02]KMP10949.1 hypothetical protein UZ36_06000 [Candidatus Nitromaritima sp. SCGC AAA799-C22]